MDSIQDLDCLGGFVKWLLEKGRRGNDLDFDGRIAEVNGVVGSSLNREVVVPDFQEQPGVSDLAFGHDEVDVASGAARTEKETSGTTHDSILNAAIFQSVSHSFGSRNDMVNRGVGGGYG